jgi:4-hydroxy-tetrahydrodipicolinate reductase
MSTLRILINGAKGRMGQEAVKAIEADADCLLVGQGSRTDNLAELIQTCHPDIVVDFTNAEAVYENTLTIIEQGVHPVVGTTGLLPEQLSRLQQLCADKQLGGIIAPNFSIGAILMMRFAEQAAAYFSHVEIIEMHHEGKLDAPSGTAIKTAELIANRHADLQPLPPCKETLIGSRGANLHHIPIHAIRLPGLVAHQQVIFGAPAETLTLKHDTINRACFMPGLLTACKKVVHLQSLVYGLENLL